MNYSSMATRPDTAAIEAPSNVQELLSRLHQASLDQEAEMQTLSDEIQRFRAAVTANPDTKEKLKADLMRTKFIALEADKATFVYQLVRATGAMNVVEAGTSFGVSTIYLALAVGQNATAAGKGSDQAGVIATEYEPEKSAQARKYWAEAGEAVEPWIDLREGDLRNTLAKDLPTVDFVLFDIWTPMVLPTLNILEPHLRHGAVLVTDNVNSASEGYADFMRHIKSDTNVYKYKSTTLPFSGGLEMTTFWGRKS